MGPPSSGGSTVGEALNILERFPRNEPHVDKLHHYLEASKLAYADRTSSSRTRISRRSAARPTLRSVRRVAALADHRHRAARPGEARRPVKYNGGGSATAAATARAATSTASRPPT
jgi:hypothetical protein